MKALKVFETIDFKRGINSKDSLEINEFKRSQDSKEALKVGIGEKILNTKAFKVLSFIADAGEEGRSTKEIQKYIYFDLNNAPHGEDWFEKKSDLWGPDPQTGNWTKISGGGGSRASRGYWNTQLYSFLDRKGLLDYYCHKNDKGKWVLDRWPERGKPIIGKPG